MHQYDHGCGSAFAIFPPGNTLPLLPVMLIGAGLYTRSAPRCAEQCLSSADHIQPDAASRMHDYVVLIFPINEQLHTLDSYLVDAYYGPPA